MRAEQADTQVEHVGARAALAHGLDQAGVLGRAQRCSPTSSGTARARAPRARRTSRRARALPPLARPPAADGPALLGRVQDRRAALAGARGGRGGERERAGGYEDWYLSRTGRRSACSTRPPSRAGTARPTTRPHAASAAGPAASTRSSRAAARTRVELAGPLGEANVAIWVARPAGARAARSSASCSATAWTRAREPVARRSCSVRRRSSACWPASGPRSTARRRRGKRLPAGWSATRCAPRGAVAWLTC